VAGSALQEGFYKRSSCHQIKPFVLLCIFAPPLFASQTEGHQKYTKKVNVALKVLSQTWYCHGPLSGANPTFRIGRPVCIGPSFCHALLICLNTGGLGVSHFSQLHLCCSRPGFGEWRLGPLFYVLHKSCVLNLLGCALVVSFNVLNCPHPSPSPTNTFLWNCLSSGLLTPSSGPRSQSSTALRGPLCAQG
jgi:hypothetical protein